MESNELTGLVAKAKAALAKAGSKAELDEWRNDYLGKGGHVSQMVGKIPGLAPEERGKYGAAVNQTKEALESAFRAAEDDLRRRKMEERLKDAAMDVTLPGTWAPSGGLHPVTRTLRRMLDIFGAMGFQVYESREVETDRNNFELLNMPPHHPARDMQDTFYVDDQVLLRTHTSPGQIHAMRERHPEPIRIVLPGMVYRHEQITPRSEIQFTQVEGLAVGPAITFADLKGVLVSFADRMFGAGRPTRFRASYFPFTEPSAEMDVQCFLCEGAGCRVCKYTGWLEILGCGMVHPAVLVNGGYDSDENTGFAFGMGVERIAMLRQGTDDIRHFWANDMRFLEQARG